MQAYDSTNISSIMKYAKELLGKTLREVGTQGVENHGYGGKGHFGQILERFYFGYNPNSDAQADFPEAGIELKSSPLKQTSLGMRAKERLVLNIINYMKVVSEDFLESSFWKKNAHLLLVFYLFEKEVDILDCEIKVVDEWKFPEVDLKIIKKDWDIIQKKIQEGNAHELSEGDTFYLGACRKGAGGEKDWREQPYNEKRSLQRAYSFKSGYVNHILASLTGGEIGKYKPLIKRTEKKSIEEVVEERFKGFYGKDISEIARKLGVELNSENKSITSFLTNRILGLGDDEESEEFNKANIVVRNIRMNEEGTKPEEATSFPAFKYEEVIKEKWINSGLLDLLERKYFLIFFQHEGGSIVLRKACFWNMPYVDIQEAQKVWDKTVSLIKKGQIFSHKAGGRRFTHFPNSSENRVCHVRPHAQNSEDNYPLPIPDIKSGVTEYTKHSFWLNDSYIGEIYRKN